MGVPPFPKSPSVGGNPFQEIKREDFEYLDDVSPKKNTVQTVKDKKWLLYGLIAVVGYFAYKKFKK